MVAAIVHPVAWWHPFWNDLAPLEQITRPNAKAVGDPACKFAASRGRGQLDSARLKWVQKKTSNAFEIHKMVRAFFFTAYGIAVGAGYVTILYLVVPPLLSVGDWVGFVFWATVILFFCGLYGWGLATTPDSEDWPKWSNVKILVCLPLMPLGMLSGLLFLGAMLLLMIVAPFSCVKWLIGERRFRNQLKAKGRFISFESLRPRLEAGEGVLIQELGIKGIYHIWWTQETGLATVIPPSSEEEFATFNSQMLKEYLDPNAGKAALTSIPPRYANSGKLSQLFPQMPITTLAGLYYLGPPISSKPDGN